MNDEDFMREALKEAEEAFIKGEVPIGAVLVREGRIIARAHNLVESSLDPTAHAETLCIRKGATILGNWRLLGCTLYCTLEPCPMCAGALIHSRMERLVWGAPDIRCGAQGSWVDLFEKEHPIHQVSITSGILSLESAALMKSFFRARRGDLLHDVGKIIR